MAVQTQSGARALILAHQMQLHAAAENHPQHVIHVQDTINYVNSVADHYSEMMARYLDTQMEKMIKAEVDKQMNDTKVQLKVDEKSVQTAKGVIRGLLDSFRIR